MYGTLMAKEMTDTTSTNNHFQSSFARSIAYQSAANRGTIKSFDCSGESTDNNSTLTFNNDYNIAGCGPVFANVSKSANISPVKSYAADGYAKISTANSRSHYKQMDQSSYVVGEIR